MKMLLSWGFVSGVGSWFLGSVVCVFDAIRRGSGFSFSGEFRLLRPFRRLFVWLTVVFAGLPVGLRLRLLFLFS